MQPATAQRMPLVSLPPNRIVTAAHPTGSIDDTITMVKGMSHVKEIGGSRGHLISFMDLQSAYYSILYMDGPEEYVLIGCSPFRANNPHYEFTYYIDGGQFGKPDGKPDTIALYKGLCDGSADSHFWEGRDPAKLMGFTPISDTTRFRANSDFNKWQEFVQELYRKTRRA